MEGISGGSEELLILRTTRRQQQVLGPSKKRQEEFMSNLDPIVPPARTDGLDQRGQQVVASNRFIRQWLLLVRKATATLLMSRMKMVLGFMRRRTVGIAS